MSVLILKINLNHVIASNLHSSTPKRPLKSSSILKGGQKNDLHPKSQILKESLVSNKFGNVPKNVDQRKNEQNLTARKQNHKENMAGNIATTTKVSSLH